VYDVVALNSPFEIGRFIAYTHVSKSATTSKDLAGDGAEAYKKTIAKYESEVKRYGDERKEIKAKAEEIAKRKLLAQDMGGNFAYALIFLQIALMLSSISSLTKRKYLWYIALAATVGWVFFFLDAWLLFY
jgi:hypothetical protein